MLWQQSGQGLSQEQWLALVHSGALEGSGGHRGMSVSKGERERRRTLPTIHGLPLPWERVCHQPTQDRPAW